MEKYFEKNMDQDINPGSDFYNYATKHWADFNKPKPEYSCWSVFSAISEMNLKRISKIIKNPDGSAISNKIYDFYKLCNDWKTRNSQQGDPLLHYLSENIYSIKTRDDIVTWCAKTHQVPFFHLYIESDEKHADNNVVYICQSGLSLGNKEYYLSKDKNNKKIALAWKHYCIDLYKAIGYSSQEAKNKYKTIWKIEKSLAKRYYSVEDSRNPELNYHKKKVKTISKSYKFDFESFLKNYGYDDTKTVIVRQESAVKYGCRLINTLSVEDLKTILECHILYYSANKLSDKFARIRFRFNKAFSGVQKRMPKEKEAINAVNAVFNEEIGKIYVKKYFNEKSKKDVLNMVDNLADTFKEIIYEKTWLSEETKQKAADKIDSLKVKIGYPNKFEDYSDCPVDTNKSYFENWMDINEYFFWKDKEKNYNKPVDKDQWYMSPHTVNAYYSPTSNEICFPAGILQAPFYDVNRKDVLNYGCIGVIIGHEMTHGYDNHGRQFDLNGNMKVWWKDEEIKIFEELSENTKKHFDNFEVLPGVKCNGTLSLGENLADYGGLKIAYNAYANIAKEDGWQKDFFIAYANSWACVDTDEHIKNLVMNDPHSPACVRVNGTLPMLNEWYEAFDINENDPLYVDPEDRAKIW